MANVQRLTKRVNELEEWVKENDTTGGPQGVLDTFTFLINETRMSAQLRTQMQRQLENLRGLAFEFIEQHELTEEWNEFLKEKEKDAVQEQQAEEVPLQEEAESGEEAVKAPKDKEKVKD
jgi:hypothetical protein